MTDFEALVFLLLALIGLFTCLRWCLGLLCFLLRPLYRWLFVPKSERLLQALISQSNQASEEYLKDTLALLHKHRW